MLEDPSLQLSWGIGLINGCQSFPCSLLNLDIEKSAREHALLFDFFLTKKSNKSWMKYSNDFDMTQLF